MLLRVMTMGILKRTLSLLQSADNQLLLLTSILSNQVLSLLHCLNSLYLASVLVNFHFIVFTCTCTCVTDHSLSNDVPCTPFASYDWEIC